MRHEQAVLTGRRGRVLLFTLNRPSASGWKALGREGDRAADARSAESAVAGGVLGEVLLVVVLGVNKNDPSTFEKFWLKHPHSSQKGITPLERYSR